MSSRKDNKAHGPGTQPLVRLVVHPATISLLLMAATLAIYWPVTGYDFIHLDDQVYVSENPQVLGGMTWDHARWAFQTVEGGSWHPLTWLSLMLDGQFFGTRPGGYHATNLLLHLANTLLLFGVLRHMTGTIWRSVFVAALFALHPLHVESVAWISERKDVLSTAFWLLTLWAYAKYVQEAKGHGASSIGSRGFWYVTALVLFALGLMSKPMLVTLPFVMLLLDYWPLQRFGWPRSLAATFAAGNRASLRRLLWEKTPFFALSAVMSAVTIWAQHRSEAVITLQNMSMMWRIENALVAYVRYLGKTFWPTNLAVYYPGQQGWDGWVVLGAGVLIMGLSLVALKCVRLHPFLAMGWFWFVGTLIPVIGLLQVGGQSMADRYTYVPLIGLFIALAWGANASWNGAAVDRGQRFLPGMMAGLALVACAVRTSGQLRHWQNSETLFRHALAVTRNNDVAHGGLGFYLLAQGRNEEAAQQSRLALAINPESMEALNNLGSALARQGRWTEAEVFYRATLKLKPDHANALNSLGLALANQGETAEALEQFRLSLQARPESADVSSNLGLALALQGRLDEAIEQYHHALKLEPNLDRALNNLGLALASQKRLDEAIDAYRRALRANPNYTDALVNLGMALTEKGEAEAAIQCYRQTLSLKPDHAEALNNLGMVLTDRGQTEEAIQCFRRAVELRPNHPQMLNNLGVALARMERNEEAIPCLEAALRYKPDHAEAHAQLGQVLAKCGRREDARHHLQEALRLQPGNAAVKELLRVLSEPGNVAK